MKPKEWLAAKAGNGLVTVVAPYASKSIVVLGASCFTSVGPEDGPVSSFVISPLREKEVVAVAIIDQCNPEEAKRYIHETFLLSVTLDDGKASVDLDFPFLCPGELIGQLLHDKVLCRLRVSPKTGGVIVSKPYFLTPAVPSNTAEVDNSKSIDRLCRELADIGTAEKKA